MFKKLMLLMALVVGSGSLIAKPGAVVAPRVKLERKLNQLMDEYYHSKNPHKKTFKHIFLNLGVPLNRIEPQGLVRDCSAFLRGIFNPTEIKYDLLDSLVLNILKEGINSKLSFDQVIGHLAYQSLSRRGLIHLRNPAVVEGGQFVSAVHLPEVILRGGAATAGVIDSIVQTANEAMGKMDVEKFPQFAAGAMFQSHIVVTDVQVIDDVQVAKLVVFGACGAQKRLDLKISTGIGEIYDLLLVMSEVNSSCKSDVSGEEFNNDNQRGFDMPSFESIVNGIKSGVSNLRERAAPSR